MKGYAQTGGGDMNRLTLLALQILVAVVSLALWHILSTCPIRGVIR